MNRITFPQLVCCTLLLVSGYVHAGMMSPCSDPIVLSGAKVQVFIMPFKAESKLTARGEQLATILQRHILFAALKYTSIGVEELTASSTRCTYEELSARVNSKLKQGQTAIYISSRLFEQSAAMRLQTTVAYATKNQSDTLKWNLSANLGTVQATMPLEPIIFADRVIPLSMLASLENAQRQSRVLHSAPDSNSSSWVLPSNPDARFTFHVLGTQNDWMHIRLQPQGEEGWIQSHALVDGSELKGTFPELYFVDGLIGYHQLRFSEPNARRRLQDMTLASFSRYLESASTRTESETRALAKVLRGNAMLYGEPTEWSRAALVAAENEYQSARTMSPTSTVANNFYLACGFALCAQGDCTKGFDALHQEYLGAIARDPTSKELLVNLQSLYAAAGRGVAKLDLTQDNIATQREIIQHAIR